MISLAWGSVPLGHFFHQKRNWWAIRANGKSSRRQKKQQQVTVGVSDNHPLVLPMLSGGLCVAAGGEFLAGTHQLQPPLLMGSRYS